MPTLLYVFPTVADQCTMCKYDDLYLLSNEPVSKAKKKIKNGQEVEFVAIYSVAAPRLGL